MAGKSTYMRQIALICVMAQIGSFVPASDARIGIVDKLFTRVGASDDLAAGQSTFMLEMTEVANILKNATKRSLIVYDEVGRGTSTYDGMAIAKSVCEYTASKKIGARCLFATHYHELIELEGTCPGVVNYSIAARKKENGVVFLRKIVRGGADDSYGIEVAQLAGVPKEVLKKAKQILAELIEKNGKPTVVHQNDDRGLVSFSMDDYIHQEVADKIRKADIDSMTPIEALNFLSEMKKLLK
jgi:DNA mismatch repair protein MutS